MTQKAFRLGIDVGGTNTDGVILDEHLKCIAKIKVHTTEDVATGIQQAIEKLLQSAGMDGSRIAHAMLGTTQCTNAIVAKKDLDRVGFIRLALPSGSAIPPLEGWTKAWRELLGEHFYQAHGGYEYNSVPITDVDEDEIRQICKKMQGHVDSVAICGVFSPLNDEQEKTVAGWVQDELPDVHISLSNRIGGLGLLERENATILNAALKGTAQRFIHGFIDALKKNNIDATPYFGQNDGTLMSKDYASQYPILTMACGPTNSLRGASHLTDIANALVVDVGGTTADIGVLNNGFPRESTAAIEIGEVRTNFRMPDIFALGIGGGTIVRKDTDDKITLGPDSVGHRLLQKGKSFGGDTLTLTDVAVAVGKMKWDGDINPIDLSSGDGEEIYQQMTAVIEKNLDRMKVSADAIPAILVGGGSNIMPDKFQGISKVVRPEHFEVANAIGVALGDISGTLDRVVALPPEKRLDILKEIEEEVKAIAIQEGASPDSVQIIDKSEIPMAYMPGYFAHVRMKAAGKIS